MLEIVDDGVGFDPEPALAAPAGGHFGLRILARRRAAAGAELVGLRRLPAPGTHWRLRVPRHDGRPACCWSTTTRWSGPGCPRCSVAADDLTVVGEAADGAQAMELAARAATRTWS